MDQNLSFAANELNKINSVSDSVNDLKLILEGYFEVLQSIYDSNPKLLEGEVFIETLSFKIISTTHSILKLTEGYYVSTTSKRGVSILIDFSSIYCLTRVMIESFLTLEYLYFNDLDNEEKLFRFNIWRISGYKSRQTFFNEKDILNKEISEKIDNELLAINYLLEKIKHSKYYKELNKQNLWKLDTFGLPRLTSWQNLLEHSVLNPIWFLKPYKLYSNYAHSEFISLIQMNEKGVLNGDSEDNSIAVDNALRTVKMICCTSIKLLENKFDCTSKSFMSLNDDLKKMIEFWYGFATDRKYTKFL